MRSTMKCMVAVSLIAHAVMAQQGEAVKTQAKRKGPLKVFILAGQSNMEGPANISTFEYIGDDPASAPLLKMMRGANGKPATCDGAWISYLTGANGSNFELHGPLTAGYGSMWGQEPTKPGTNIGPEFTFGLAMDAALEEPVLIIKAAWGGMTLHTNFRPPSAGPYELPKATKELWAQNPNGAHGIPSEAARAKWFADQAAGSGVQYRLMMDHIKRVLADPKRICPAYDPKSGIKVAGFVWLQGFNDLVDGTTYPNWNQPGAYDEYARLLACFIRDVRKDLSAPKMPFVIGVMGLGGIDLGGANPNLQMANFRHAMSAPASMPEFKGNVVAVETAPFFASELAAIDQKREKVSAMRSALRDKHQNAPNADGHMTEEQQGEFMKKFEADLISPAEMSMWKRGASNAGYHYYGCAKTFAQMGKAFAEAIVKLQK